MANPDNPRPEEIIDAPSVTQRMEMIGGALVYVWVGTRKRLHKIPKRLLRNTSQCFQDNIDRLEAEGETDPIHMSIPDISNKTFKVLLEYMYDGKMFPGAITPMQIGVEGLREAHRIIEIAHGYGIGRAACVGLHDAIKNLIHHHFPTHQALIDDHYSMISDVLHYRRWVGDTRPAADHLHVYIIVNQEIPGYGDHTEGLLDKLTMVMNSVRDTEAGLGWVGTF